MYLAFKILTVFIYLEPFLNFFIECIVDVIMSIGMTWGIISKKGERVNDIESSALIVYMTYNRAVVVLNLVTVLFIFTLFK